ncbi:WXG100 family type VII secretion target [Nocardia cyriacigeorgica]|uniref:WXG100 family type VII secretion target n=1 Tax=Nocardia cyriacigeorgica TaxID=135487 RepID=UPI002458A9EA|nr:WXG100 family type VII secretion target [Nocardia cyriacigeorgica]
MDRTNSEPVLSVSVSMGETPVSNSTVTVVPEQVREVGQYLYDVAEAVRAALESAARDVDSLTDGGWRGGAATQFTEGWTELRDGGVQIISALTGMAEKLGVTADNYQAQDEGTAAALTQSSLNIVL